MKKFILLVLVLFATSSSYATGLKQSVEKVITQIKTGNGLSIEQVELLSELDQKAVTLKLGYSICRSYGNSNLSCTEDGTLGYALCRAAGNSNTSCEDGGTLGYGICRAAGISNISCDDKGSVGYGLCRSLGNSNSQCVD